MDLNTDITYIFISDPGHGWLRIPLANLGGYKPTVYSYYDDEFAYLEEDCDALGWAKHNNLTISELRIQDSYVDTFDRFQRRFK